MRTGKDTNIQVDSEFHVAGCAKQHETQRGRCAMVRFAPLHTPCVYVTCPEIIPGQFPVTPVGGS